ncbi:Fc.00g007680.m01.CDS01 [Cosmosporella sp. VM-42]
MALLNSDLILSLKKPGIAVLRVVHLDSVQTFEGDIGKSFELLHRTSKAVAEAMDSGSFPIVLAGNCCATVGVCAGIRGSEFDAHHDYNTLDIITHGYFDSMGVSMLAGESWKGLLHTTPYFAPLDLSRDFIHVGMRDEIHHKRILAAGFLTIRPFLTRKASRCTEELYAKMVPREAVMVHIDADVLDPGIGRANKYSA